MNFKIASGSSIGKVHRDLFYNNQDSYSIYHGEDIVIGVVTDGSSSGSNNEVGAKLCSDFVMNYCINHFRNSAFDLEKLQNAIIEYLHKIVDIQQTDDKSNFIQNYLYFTILGFIIKANDSFVFHAGDGVILINNTEFIIDQNNRPKYLGRNLLGEKTQLECKQIETNKLERILIATDGLIHLNNLFLQGADVDNLTSISDFFDSKKKKKNEIILSKFLTDWAINKHILADDTTIILCKRVLKLS